ncbi:RIP metalloprotease RseP [bacterium]|nr:RIP metalloprotease RseP [bacterium]
MITLLSTVFVLGVLVFIHELGHFLCAKLFHIRVERFSLGYPPRMIGKKVGDTDYCLSWIPFGGYVKITGMIDESMDTDTLEAAPKPWEFRAHPWIQRMLVIFAGPFMNIFFTFAVIWAAGMISGEAVYNEGSVVGSLVENLPAVEAGLLPGDKITSINEQPVTTWDDMTRLIRSSGGETIDINVVRADSAFQLTITPLVHEQEQDGQTVRWPQIGIERDFTIRHINPVESAGRSIKATWALGRFIVEAVVKLVTGKESIKNLAGPVGIAKMAGDSARAGWATLISFMALLSLNLAILNLMPIPVLDGGHMFFLTIEGIIRRDIPLKVKMIIQQVGMAVLLVFMIFVIYNDVIRVFK